jgi:hypothetical protein
MEAIKTYPYPAQEHYEEPGDIAAQVREELRLYPTQEDMNTRLRMLHSYYDKTPYMQSLREMAECAVAIGSFESATGPTDINTDFYDGMLMAVHASIVPEPKAMRFYLLRSYVMPHSQDGRLDVDHTVESLQKWATDGWKEFYDIQDKPYRTTMMDIATLTYDGQPNASDREFDFVLGYTLATNLAWTHLNNYKSSAPII